MWFKVCFVSIVAFLVTVVILSVLGVLGKVHKDTVIQCVVMMIIVLFLWVPCCLYLVFKKFRKRLDCSSCVHRQEESIALGRRDDSLRSGRNRSEAGSVFESAPAEYSQEESSQVNSDTDPPPPYDESPPTYAESCVFPSSPNTFLGSQIEDRCRHG